MFTLPLELPAVFPATGWYRGQSPSFDTIILSGNSIVLAQKNRPRQRKIIL
jgi:hypothetical protein